MPNRLYYGDNLPVMRRYLKDKSVDLVYLDPPFNSKADYNVLFAEHNGTRSTAQIKVFTDTWHWGPDAAVAFDEIVQGPDAKVAQTMLGLRQILGDCDMLAYLAMMAPRLVEIRRILKDAGSMYLHCDWHADSYLRVLCDALFIDKEPPIVWKRYAGVKNTATKRYSVQTDTILFYANSASHVFNMQYREMSKEYIRQEYKYDDENGRYALLRGRMYQESGGTPKKKYLKDAKGSPVTTLWDDSGMTLNTSSSESLGYPTQKPEALLDRIILASSNPGDVVFDPFSGCGTLVSSAQRLERQWIGIDVTSLAITLIKSRLQDTYGDTVVDKDHLTVIGEPTTLTEAQTLADSDKYQFQWWALGLVGARPADQKKGADKGIDGRRNLKMPGNKYAQVIFSVKGGDNVKAGDVRDLRGVIEREQAAVGILITMVEPTKPMQAEAASAGFWAPPDIIGTKYARVQILTIAQVLGGQQPSLPVFALDATVKHAPPAKKAPRPRTDTSRPLFETPDTTQEGK